MDGVSFSLRPGRVSALVGQSGSGKTTLARLVTGVERPTSGGIRFQDTQVDELGRRALRRYRRHVQLVFQDPFSALNPTRTIAYAIARPLHNHLGMDKKQARQRAGELLETVGMSPPDATSTSCRTSSPVVSASGSSIARALATEPEILIADEPISMLDVSIRAEIVALLDRLVRERRIAMLYITHDLLSARLLADEVMVLNQGVVVEHGPTLEVIRSAKDPYTKTLLAAISRPGAAARRCRGPGESSVPVDGAGCWRGARHPSRLAGPAGRRWSARQVTSPRRKTSRSSSSASHSGRGRRRQVAARGQRRPHPLERRDARVGPLRRDAALRPTPVGLRQPRATRRFSSYGNDGWGRWKAVGVVGGGGPGERDPAAVAAALGVAAAPPGRVAEVGVGQQAPRAGRARRRRTGTSRRGARAGTAAPPATPRRPSGSRRA